MALFTAAAPAALAQNVGYVLADGGDTLLTFELNNPGSAMSQSPGNATLVGSFSDDFDDITGLAVVSVVTAVPVPPALGLFGAGLALLSGRTLRRRWA